MHWNTQKIDAQGLQKVIPSRASFTLWISVKKCHQLDCFHPIGLFPSNEPRNLWKPTCPSKYLTGDTLSAMIGQLEGFLGLTMAISNHGYSLNNGFFDFFSSRSLQSAKIWPRSSILVLFWSLVGHWNMQSCFPMFVGVFQAIRGVKNDQYQKMSFVWVYSLMK